jgi:AraC family transcriptional regulator
MRIPDASLPPIPLLSRVQRAEEAIMPTPQLSNNSGFDAEGTSSGASAIGLGKAWEKYGSTGLLLSSADRAWTGLSAELRYHSKGVLAWTAPQSDTEICVDVCGNGSAVTRRAAGIEDRRVASRGSIWLTPAGFQEGSVDIAEDLPRILHIYLSLSRFCRNLGVDESGIGVLNYEKACEDPLLAEIANAITSELQVQTSAGTLLVDALANSLAARLLQKHIIVSRARFLSRPTREGLHRRRLCRILDYIDANVEGDLTMDRMASIACVSKYHFARSFKQAVGQSPHATSALNALTARKRF